MSKEIIFHTYANHLAEGTSVSGHLCPKCFGGSSQESSLSVSNIDGFLKWKCHRNSCGFQGSESLLLSEKITAGLTMVPARKRPLSFHSVPLSAEHFEHLHSSFGIEQDTALSVGLEFTLDHCVATPNCGRIVIPLRGWDRSTPAKGNVLRAISKDEPTKSLTLKNEEASGLPFFKKIGSKRALLVEDCWSAIRASKYINTVPLLGTHLSNEAVDELRELEFKTVYLALDKDAFGKSIDLVYRYKAKLPLQVVLLTKDIKNMTEAEFIDFIENEGLNDEY